MNSANKDRVAKKNVDTKMVPVDKTIETTCRSSALKKTNVMAERRKRRDTRSYVWAC